MKTFALLFVLTTTLLLAAAGAAQDWQERYRQYRESTEDFVASQVCHIAHLTQKEIHSFVSHK